MKSLILLVLFVPFSGLAMVKDQVLELLPKDLQGLSSKDTVTELKAKLGRKVKKEDAKGLYLHYFGASNDVTVGLEKGQAAFLYVEATQAMKEKATSLFQQSTEDLSREARDRIEREGMGAGHAQGTFITVDLPKEKLKLKFHNNEKRELHSIVLRLKDAP